MVCLEIMSENVIADVNKNVMYISNTYTLNNRHHLGKVYFMLPITCEFQQRNICNEKKQTASE